MMKNKKIIIVGMGLFEEQAGGANKYMKDFADSLYEKYNNIEIFVPKIDNSKFRNENYKYKVNRFNDIKGIKNFIKRNKMVRQQFDNMIINNKKRDIIINSHFALCAYPLLKLCKKNNIDIITHFHGPWALETKVQYDNIYSKVKYVIAKYIEKRVYTKSKYIITLSNAFKDILIKEYNICPNKIKVIPGATTINKDILKISKEEAKEMLGWDLSKKYILTIRRLVKRMGIDLFLDAISEINTEGFKFIIGGKGELKEQLEKKIKSMDADIELTGYISDDEIEVYYRAADLYFLPTIDLEGFGLVTIEAMRYGTPVIATNVGGSKEILYNESRGVLVNPRKEDFKEILKLYMSNNIVLPNENDIINIVKTEYSWNRVINEFLKLID